MFADDDDEDTAAAGTVVRYAVLPSLVAAQQMKNRLSLASTGKKLMKWTATAANRELRKLAGELVETNRCFEKMGNCYMAVARLRFISPYIHDVVLENVSENAAVKVTLTQKSAAGVKLVLLTALETGVENYAHLGIGRGGESVAYAKRVWRDILLKFILCCQQRRAFTILETAHKNATKKKQMLGKIVIPKIQETIRYIMDELEEKEREDTFRLKRFMELKTKKNMEKNRTDKVTCPVCFTKFTPKDDRKECPVCSEGTPAKTMRYSEKPKQIKTPPPPPPSPPPLPLPSPPPPPPPEVVTPKASERIKPPNPPVTPKASERIKPPKPPETPKVFEPKEPQKLPEPPIPVPIVPPCVSPPEKQTEFLQKIDPPRAVIQETIVPPCVCAPEKPKIDTSIQPTPIQSTIDKETRYVPPCDLVSRTPLDIPSMSSKAQSPCPSGTLPQTEKPCGAATKQEDELGTFENKLKEIVRVTRHLTCDGSICEKKEFITIRTEKRIPRQVSTYDGITGKRSCFHSRSDSQDICNDCQARKTKSEHVRSKRQMGEPVVSPNISSSSTIPNRHRIPCSGSYDDTVKSETSQSPCCSVKSCSTMTSKPKSTQSSNNRKTASKKSGTCCVDSKSVQSETNTCCKKGSMVCGNQTQIVAFEDASTSTTSLGTPSTNQRKTNFQIGTCTSCPKFSVQPSLRKLSPNTKNCLSEIIQNELELEKPGIRELAPVLKEALSGVFRTVFSAKKTSTLQKYLLNDVCSSNSIQCQVDSDTEIEVTQCASCGSITIKSVKSTPNEVRDVISVNFVQRARNCKSFKSNSTSKAKDNEDDVKHSMTKLAKSAKSIVSSRKKSSSYFCTIFTRESRWSLARRSARFDLTGTTSTSIRSRSRRDPCCSFRSDCIRRIEKNRSDTTITQDKERSRTLRKSSSCVDDLLQ